MRMYHSRMRMSHQTTAVPGPPHLQNHLPQHLAASGLSVGEVALRVEVLTGSRLDRRTLRRYLAGDPILDATAVTLAAICGALGVSLDQAVELEPQDPLDLVLTRAGRPLVTSEVSAPPAGWGKPSQEWGNLVTPFLEDRRARY
ncbi:MAG: hypothetical protein NVSMB17_00580 [Candidatus Dormibacteria bacterium]